MRYDKRLDKQVIIGLEGVRWTPGNAIGDLSLKVNTFESLFTNFLLLKTYYSGPYLGPLGQNQCVRLWPSHGWQRKYVSRK